MNWKKLQWLWHDFPTYVIQIWKEMGCFILTNFNIETSHSVLWWSWLQCWFHFPYCKWLIFGRKQFPEVLEKVCSVFCLRLVATVCPGCTPSQTDVPCYSNLPRASFTRGTYEYKWAREQSTTWTVFFELVWFAMVLWCIFANNKIYIWNWLLSCSLATFSEVHHN